MTKHESYRQLVASRKACQRCVGLTNPADVDDGRYDSAHIGPWSTWQGNLNAEVVVVGQDWGDTRYFRTNHGVDGPGNPTNNALIELFRTLGLDLGQPGESNGRSVAFLTNAILCLKQGGLQASVQASWFDNCAGYLRQQIEIIQPQIVLGLGERAFRAVLAGFGLRAGAFRLAVDDPSGTLLPNGSRVFAVYHCGARIQNTHRSLEAQRDDWARVLPFLKQAG